MGKEHVVIAQDELGIKSEQAKREKKVLVHEQLYEKYGINPEKVYENSGRLKNITKNDIKPIIEKVIGFIKIPRISQVAESNSITLEFESAKLCETFYEEYNKNLARGINTFIEEKGEKPENYNRIIVTEILISGNQITIRY